MGALTPLGIMQQDAMVWKKRALAAEAKLHGYRRLRELADAVTTESFNAAVAKSYTEDLDTAVVAMIGEIQCLEVVDAPKDYFDQELDLGEGVKLSIKTRGGLSGCADLNVDAGEIVINGDQAAEGKAIGLVFHLAQLADIATGMHLGGEKQVLTGPRLHSFAPALLSLLAVTGLLNPELGVTHEGVERFVGEMEPAEAAST